MKEKIKFIPNHNKMTCWTCKGKVDNKKCQCCDGTGIFVDVGYHLIAKDNSGQLIGFSVDTIK